MGLILVVSEDLVEIETIRAALSVQGWWITVAADRQAALQVAADQAPKLVIVDNNLAGSVELFRSFGANNGGPGVVALVAEGFDGSLDLKEAGVDELLTKPVAPPSVLQVVQRCLEAPRSSPGGRRAPAEHRLTTEEIFGDVLRELEEGEAPPAPEAPAMPQAAAVADGPPPATADDLFDPAPDPEPIVSLAGLFEDAPTADAPEPPLGAPTASTAGEWQGEERRGAERPWSSVGTPPEPSLAPDREAEPVVHEASDRMAAGDAHDEADTVACDDARDEADTVVFEDAQSAVREILAPISETASPEAEDAGAAWIEDPAAPAPRRRGPRSALAIGALAAVLLAAAGVVFYLGRGAGPPAPPAGPPAPIETMGEAAADDAPALTPPPAPGPGAEAAAAEVAVAVPVAAAPGDELDEVDLEAIVDEELERREEALRRVFLEEEKRLLRELNNLDPDESTPAAAAEGDAGDAAGAGR